MNSAMGVTDTAHGQQGDMRLLLERLARVETQLNTCLSEMDKLKLDNETLRTQVGAGARCPPLWLSFSTAVAIEVAKPSSPPLSVAHNYHNEHAINSSC